MGCPRGRLAQVERALVSGTKGPAFESRIAYHENQGVRELSLTPIFFDCVNNV